MYILRENIFGQLFCWKLKNKKLEDKRTLQPSFDNERFARIKLLLDGLGRVGMPAFQTTIPDSQSQRSGIQQLGVVIVMNSNVCTHTSHRYILVSQLFKMLSVYNTSSAV